MNSVPKSALAAETPTRVLNDGQLAAAGWVVEDTRNLNLSIAQHVARREAIMATGHGRADYLLYLDRRVVGMIEASRSARRCPEWNGSRRCTPPACPLRCA